MFVLLNCPVQSLSHTRHCCATNTLLMILLWHYKLFMAAIMSPQFFWFALVISPGWACHRHLSSISTPYLGLCFLSMFPGLCHTQSPSLPASPLLLSLNLPCANPAITSPAGLWTLWALQVLRSLLSPQPHLPILAVLTMKLSTFLNKLKHCYKNTVMPTVFIFILSMLSNWKQKIKGC